MSRRNRWLPCWSSSAIRIVGRLRRDELSSAPLQSRSFSARYYLVAALSLRGGGGRLENTPPTDCLDRYRDMATSLGFEGHMAWAEAMA